MAAWSLALLVGPASKPVKAVCGLNDPGGCSVLWQSPFALAVHRGTGVSVAGWGVVWGAAALALALLALVSVTRGQRWTAAVTALRCLSAAGLQGVFVLAAVSVSERTFCAACALAYALAVSHGPAAAPVRFTEFTDVRCSHCAELYKMWEELRRALPPGSFSVEPRFFPLENACNSQVRPRATPDLVRCLAPLAEICLEDQPAAASLAGALFAEQRTLTPERVSALAARYDARGTLRACVASEETAGKPAD